MSRLRRTLGIAVCVGFLTLLSPGSDSLRNRPLAQNLTPAEGARTATKPAAVQPVSNGNSLMEREAALNLKEQEMKKLEQSLDSRIQELEATKKGLETSLARKKIRKNTKKCSRSTSPCARRRPRRFWTSLTRMSPWRC